MTSKADIRKAYLHRRMGLSEEDYQSLSHQICDHFFKHVDLEHINAIHIFLPLKKKREPNTWLIIDKIQKIYPSINIAVPRITPEGKLVSHLLNKEELTVGFFGIEEPASHTPLYPHHHIDLIIVPLLAIDKCGHRIGYGKGHYDHFFQSCRKDCLKIGLSFFPPIANIKERYVHDVALDGCITPTEFISWKH